jgi:hypothetical protein
VDIKKLKPSGRYKSGKYFPINQDKYVGDIHNIIYRSSWERKFCNYCDINPNILKWSSEPLFIPYWSPIDKREHKYFIDFYIKVKKGSYQYKSLIPEPTKPISYDYDEVFIIIRSVYNLAYSGMHIDTIVEELKRVKHLK